MLVVQVYQGVLEYQRNQTIQTTGTLAVKDAPFPDIVFCNKTGFDLSQKSTYLNIFGYARPDTFNYTMFLNSLKHNGWCNNIPRNITCDKHLESFANMKHIENYIKSGYLSGNVSVLKEFSKTKINLFNGLCYKLSLNMTLMNQEAPYVLFTFNQIQDLEIVLTDPNYFNPLKYDAVAMAGDKIELEFGEHVDAIAYNVELHQIQENPADQAAKCENYGPGHRHGSYQDCMYASAEEDFYFVGCSPPWFTRKDEKICKRGKITKENYQIFTLTPLAYVTGNPLEKCMKPCKRIKVKITFVYQSKVGEKENSLQLYINPWVTTTTSIRKVTLFTVINNIGSSIWLWLGISVFTVFEVIASVSNGLMSKTPVCLLRKVLGIIVGIIAIVPFIICVVFFWVEGLT